MAISIINRVAVARNVIEIMGGAVRNETFSVEMMNKKFITANLAAMPVGPLGLAPNAAGSMPCVACMVLAIFILCLFPEIATWLPSSVMGRAI